MLPRCSASCRTARSSFRPSTGMTNRGLSPNGRVGCHAASCLCSVVRPVLAMALFWAGTLAHALPTYDEVRAAHVSTEGVLLDRHGEVLHELRVDMKGRRLDWVPLDQVSPAFLRVVVRAEDKGFYQHHGVDWLALTDA